jgi:hypothetical protein|tara:strand:+ start:2054 stop:2158 length:105 start_codon:yes stop_codon:yes gene_type:complete
MSMIEPDFLGDFSHFAFWFVDVHACCGAGQHEES